MPQDHLETSTTSPTFEPPPLIYISYSRKDEPWLEKILVRLKPMEASQQIRIFYDRNLDPGDNWDEALRANLKSAALGIILLSPEWLANDYATKTEFPALASRRVIPVLVRECDWHSHPVSQFQVLRAEDKPLSAVRSTKQEQAFRTLLQSIQTQLGISSEAGSTEAPAGPTISIPTRKIDSGRWSDPMVKLIEPASILGKAIEAVPAVKYALGIAGIVAVIAIIVGGWKIDPLVAVVGVIIMLVFMVVLRVFAVITATGAALAAIVFLWFCLLIFMSTVTFLFTSVFWDWPVPLRARIFASSPKLPSPVHKQDSKLEFVDYRVTYPHASDTLVPEVDLKLRNIGDKVAFIKEAAFEVLNSATFEDCAHPKYRLTNASAKYDVDLLKSPVKPISHSIKPDEVDRIKFRVFRKVGGPTLTVYKTVLSVVYDEDNKIEKSQPFFLKMIGPTVPLAVYSTDGKNAASATCIQRNIVNFQRIGWKIYKDQRDCIGCTGGPQ